MTWSEHHIANAGRLDRTLRSGHRDGAYRAWIYVSCSQTSGATKAADSCAFTLSSELAPGDYEPRLYANNRYSRLAISNSFFVTP